LDRICKINRIDTMQLNRSNSTGSSGIRQSSELPDSTLGVCTASKKPSLVQV